MINKISFLTWNQLVPSEILCNIAAHFISNYFCSHNCRIRTKSGSNCLYTHTCLPHLILKRTHFILHCSNHCYQFVVKINPLSYTASWNYSVSLTKLFHFEFGRERQIYIYCNIDSPALRRCTDVMYEG